MDELEAIRQQKKDAFRKQQEEERALREQVGQLEAFVKTRMTKEALARFGNIKVAHPKKAMQALAILSKLLEAGKAAQVDDQLIKDVLSRLAKHDTEIKIRRV